MGHPAEERPNRGGRQVRLRHADVRADPNCSTCGGTGRFVADWKAASVPLPCPRCLGPRSAHPLREERRRVRPDVLAES